MTFLICGSWLDDNNHVDFNLMTDTPAEVDPEITFITFSPRDGLCGFTASMVKHDPRAQPLRPKKGPDIGPPPMWTCGVGCTPPAELDNLTMLITPESQRWLLHLCLNAHKLKYMDNENLYLPCSINKHAT